VNRLALTCVAICGCGRIDFTPLAAADASRTPRTYRDVVIEDSPLSYWRLAESALGVARDEMGRVDGTYEGGCAFAVTGALTGDPDTAVQFDGTTCRVALDARTPFDGVAPFTVEAWALHPTIPGASGFQVYLMDEVRSTNPVDGYALLLSNTAGVYLERAAGGTNRLTPRQLIAAGAWHHVVGTYDSLTLTLFIDGAQVSTNGNVTESVDSTGSLPYIGSQSTAGPTGLLDGSLDEVAIYDHPLSPERVAEHYRIGTNGPE
jgi:hypothetical protein